MNIKCTVALLTALLGLTACAGSGKAPVELWNGSKTQNPIKGTSNTSTSTTTPIWGSNSSTAATSNSALSATQNDFSNIQTTEVSGDYNSEELTINGHTFTIRHQEGTNIQSGNFTNISDSTQSTITSGSKFSYVRFGGHAYRTDEVQDKIYNSFAVGNITPNSAIPSTGKFNYLGNNVGSVSGEDFERGTAIFNVDFSAKTIKGSISAGNNDVSLEGKITGNSFSGDKNNVQMQGNFYGPKAEELGGTYHGKGSNGNYFMGAFGAKKQ